MLNLTNHYTSIDFPEAFTFIKYHLTELASRTGGSRGAYLLSEPEKTLKIAIVDDEKELLNVFTKVLEMLGYPTPDVFNDGTSFIRSLERNLQIYDVVLMDYRMPEMNGIEAAKIVIKLRPQTKIIMITGIDHVKEKAAEIGVLYLQKPFTAKQLAECLNKLKLENA